MIEKIKNWFRKKGLIVINTAGFLSNSSYTIKGNPYLYAVINLIVRNVHRLELATINANNGNEVDNRVTELIKQPNPFQNWRLFFEKLLADKLEIGNAYILVSRGVGDKPARLDIVQDADVRIENEEYFYKGQKAEIIHIKNWLVGDDGKALSPIKIAKEILKTSSELQRQTADAVSSAGKSGIVYIDGDNVIVDDTAKSEIKEAINDRGRFTIVNNKVGFINTSLKVSDLSTIELGKMTLRDICNIYGVNSKLLNDPENTTYNNMNEAKRGLLENVFIPEIEQIVAEINNFLLREFKNENTIIKLNYSKFTELEKDKSALINSLQNAWYMTPNERRALLGLPPVDIPEGNQILVPSNLIPMDE
jgi:HK97 family phage portal protein